MWSSWYQSEPGPSTVENRAHTECSTLSRSARDTVRSVSEIDWPLASFSPRTSSALARPCSDSLAPVTPLRPRQSNESKLSRSLMTLPRLAASGAMSVRIQSATAVAMGQRKVAAGFSETRRLSGSTTASSRTRSSPPQSPECGLFGRLVGLDRRRLFCRRGLFGFDDRRIGRTRLWHRHRCGERGECCLPPRLRPCLSKLRPDLPKQIAPQTMTMLPSRGGLGLRAKHQQHCCNGNHCREGATKALTRPFAACFLRAKVHGNEDLRQAITPSGGTFACLD